MTSDTMAQPKHVATHMVAMRDGIRLATDVLVPDGTRPWPAVLVRTPYGRVFQREDAERLVSEGVAVVVQDVRGRFNSEGDFDLGATDHLDGADTVAWVTTQPWCDGRVAGRGTSYPGITQWKTAIERPDGLTCIAPMMCPPWWRRLGFREGGAILWALAAHWLPLQAAWERDIPDGFRERFFERAFGDFTRVTTDGRIDPAKAVADPALGRMPAREPWPVEGAPTYEELWRRIFDEPDGAASWIADPGPAADDAIDVPTLVVGSWYDVNFTPGQVAAFRHLRRTSPPDVAQAHRLIMSPHGHGFDLLREADVGPDSLRFHLDTDRDWALEWLLDRTRDLRDLPPVTYFTIGPNEWRHADDFPPPGARGIRLHLDPAHGTLAERVPDESSELSFVYDPRDPVPTRGGAGLGLPPGPCDQDGLTGGARPDVLSFDAPPLAQPLEITGPVTARLYAASDAPDTDFTVKLVDVAPDGRATSILDGIVRARSQVGRLRPGVHELAVHLGVVSYELAAGHRVRIDVSSSNFPKFDRNPNTGQPLGTDGPGDLRSAVQHVYGGGAMASHVELSVMGGTT